MIYVYAIGDADVAAPAVRGPGGHAVHSVREGTLTAYVSDATARAVEPRADALWGHEQVVASLMEGGTVLPLRFGTVLEAEGAVRSLLSARREEFAQSLDRVRGRVEFGVRGLWRERPAQPAATGGREFMVRRLERLRAARGAADALHRPLAELCAQSRWDVRADDDAAFTAAYLVDRVLGAELWQRARRLRDARADVQLVCTGPWAPYSFSEARDA